ncbi:MAG: hypothetical protein CME98_14695 [Hyphomonas sp.]|nr:hypothetical protein [Hyphomonas sp.]
MIDATSSQAYEARGLWDARRSQGLWSFGEDPPAHSAPRLLITEHRSIRQSRGKASPAEKRLPGQGCFQCLFQ